MSEIIRLIRRIIGSLKKIDGLQNMYNFFERTVNKRTFLNQIGIREKLSLFDYEQLSKPIPFCPFEKIKDSNYYGYVRAIKDYIGQPNAEINIEHGLYFDNIVSYFTSYDTFKTLMTFSDYRLNVIRENGAKKRLLAIGPYIHYATPLLPQDESFDLKGKLGRTLLYLPYHSTNLSDGTSPMFNEEVKMIDNIRKEHKFDNVIVCVYYRDLKFKKCIDVYKEYGFKITTAGHQYDLNFVRRLKSIILLADVTVSNKVGTNLGFCIYLKKPHIVINDYPNKYNTSKQGGRICKELSDIFSEYSETITNEQYEMVDKYWGLGAIKSREQIIEFLGK
ncbi:MAG: hypothetical protein ACI3Y2_05995 [Candidatus Egerieousia sp.]